MAKYFFSGIRSIRSCISYVDDLYRITSPITSSVYIKVKEETIAGGKFVQRQTLFVLKETSQFAIKQSDIIINAGKVAEKQISQGIVQFASKELEVVVAKFIEENASWLMALAKKSIIEAPMKTISPLVIGLFDACLIVNPTTNVTGKENIKSETNAKTTTTALIPILTISYGIITAIYRVGFGVYFFSNGQYWRGTGEFGKAGLKLMSGFVGSFTGLGTAATLGVQAIVFIWDIADGNYKQLLMDD